ncbi:MAG: response regulator [Treponema sp.]|nr:response regulator [Treponema sp.]MDD7450303.1 response regulator [Treponema sp.]MDY2924122.1 response regulator [Treponema sp.]MDY5683545.1 response regulator [Treponema sp.]
MYKVLIVEDDPMVAMINEQYVKVNRNFTVAFSCRNGQDAIAYIEKNPVDLVILDVFMPYMDGIETLKILRQKKFSCEVIMVTAANDTSTLEETMHLGVVDYLIKPFAYERFQVALEKFACKVDSLRSSSVLNQNSIDSILSNSSKKSETEYPKGIQAKTVDLILKYIENNCGWQNGDTIAENVRLSNVTVRHYMNFLAKNGKIIESINYETGGRPSILYKKKED